jgi:uncharacterized membrane protein YfcA
MSANEILIILASFVTAAISAGIGIGGGSLLLGLMANVLPLSIVIPLHGIAQSFSNIGKAYLGREFIDFSITLPFVIGAIIGTGIGLLIWMHLPLSFNQMLLGGFLLISTWRPTWLYLHRISTWIGGIISSVLSVFSGATGPLVMALLPIEKLSSKQIIATHGTIMTIHHAIKVVGFVLIGFSITEHALLIIGLFVASLGGSFVGNRMMIRLSEKTAKKAIKWVLTLLAINLIISELY